MINCRVRITFVKFINSHITILLSQMRAFYYWVVKMGGGLWGTFFGILQSKADGLECSLSSARYFVCCFSDVLMKGVWLNADYIFITPTSQLTSWLNISLDFANISFGKCVVCFLLIELDSCYNMSASWADCAIFYMNCLSLLAHSNFSSFN